MSKKDEFFDKAFETLKQEGIPTEQQRDIMLDYILKESKAKNISGIGKIKTLIVSYPWRFAFTASAVQAVIFTMIFGTQYTNLFLSFFGG